MVHRTNLTTSINAVMSQRSPLTKKSEAPVRNRIFPAISGKKDVTVISDYSPKETQEGDTCHSAALRLQPLRTRSLSGKEAQGVKTRILSEVHMKKGISLSPDSLIFPYTEDTKFLNLGYMVFFN